MSQNNTLTSNNSMIIYNSLSLFIVEGIVSCMCMLSYVHLVCLQRDRHNWACTCNWLFCQCSLLARLLCPWNFPGKNTGVGCSFLLQGIFLTQGLNQHLLNWQADCLPLGHQGSQFYCVFSSCGIVLSCYATVSTLIFTCEV